MGLLNTGFSRKDKILTPAEQGRKREREVLRVLKRKWFKKERINLGAFYVRKTAVLL